jgi:hypothetical protein
MSLPSAIYRRPVLANYSRVLTFAALRETYA